MLERLLGQAHQEIHGPAHVGSDQDRNPIGQTFECRGAPPRRSLWCRRRVESRAPRTGVRHRERALRQREIDHDVQVRPGGQRGCERDAQRGNPGQDAGILAELSMPGPLEGGAQLELVILGNELDQPRAHPAAAPWMPTFLMATFTGGFPFKVERKGGSTDCAGSVPE